MLRGDYVLSGGELAALVVTDAVCRLLPGALGCADSAERDSFSRSLLKHNQYTRPPVFADLEVPAVLLSGDHAAVARHRFVESVRPDPGQAARFARRLEFKQGRAQNTQGRRVAGPG